VPTLPAIWSGWRARRAGRGDPAAVGARPESDDQLDPA